jgi:DNA-binding PadR family transcriptional regulator
MPRRSDIQPPDPGLLILASLASGPKHGYAITQDVRAFAGVALGPGTL